MGEEPPLGLNSFAKSAARKETHIGRIPQQDEDHREDSDRGPRD
jgi:hypothetical protein